MIDQSGSLGAMRIATSQNGTRCAERNYTHTYQNAMKGQPNGLARSLVCILLTTVVRCQLILGCIWAPSSLCHQLPGLASFTIRTAALAAAVPRHPSWKGGIRASAKASSSSLGRVARRLLFLLFGASADSLQNRMGKAYIHFSR